MARDYVISGETLVRVKGNPSSAIASLSELGLAEKEVRIVPRFIHQDVHTDDFGPEIPAEVLAMLADVTIRMTLVHYDKSILDTCLAESLGGGTPGVMPGAGVPMGAYSAVTTGNNHFISLNLLSPQLNFPWRFRAAYLANTPAEIPIGTERTLAVLTWRAIPYAFPPSSVGEIQSKGTILWDRTLDS